MPVSTVFINPSLGFFVVAHKVMEIVPTVMLSIQLDKSLKKKKHSLLSCKASHQVEAVWGCFAIVRAWSGVRLASLVMPVKPSSDNSGILLASGASSVLLS